jgi:hypothetical protein
VVSPSWPDCGRQVAAGVFIHGLRKTGDQTDGQEMNCVQCSLYMAIVHPYSVGVGWRAGFTAGLSKPCMNTPRWRCFELSVGHRHSMAYPS